MTSGAILRHADIWCPRSALASLGKDLQPHTPRACMATPSSPRPRHTHTHTQGSGGWVRPFHELTPPLLLRRGLRKKFMTLTFLSPHKTRFVNCQRKTASYKGKCGHTLSSKPQPHTMASRPTHGQQAPPMSSGDGAPGSLR